jgi:negative regulator of flagellin synthesis FlgM
MNIRKIADLFQQNAALGQSSAQKVGKNAVGSNNSNASSATGSSGNSAEDTVQISSIGRQFSSIARILNDDEQVRAKKVQGIKDAIARGDYKVSSEDVAESLVSFGSPEA